MTLARVFRSKDFTRGFDAYRESWWRWSCSVPACLKAQEKPGSEEEVETCVRLLAQQDDRLDLPDLNGRTALHLASMLREEWSTIRS